VLIRTDVIAGARLAHRCAQWHETTWVWLFVPGRAIGDCRMTATRTVLITGAGSGIGRATAKLFVANAWNVAASMRAPERSDLAAKSTRLRLLRLDVTDPASIEAAIGEAIRVFGAIDVLVNNAGYALVGPFEAMSEAQVRRQLETNVLGLMSVTRAILPHMRQRKSGTIVNVASVGGRLTFPLYSVYNASKWAVDGFSEALSFELAEHGIAVKIIEPGPIKTDFYGRSQDLARREGLTAYDRFVARVMPVIQRAGATAPGPEIVAESIWAAATDGSDRLRYAPNGMAMLAARRMLPDRLYRAAIRIGLGA
jgi:NAD(P)-dependent dehydrogenase (short-subunit alcohol dehydrogenase family)